MNSHNLFYILYLKNIYSDYNPFEPLRFPIDDKLIEDQVH